MMVMDRVDDNWIRQPSTAGGFQYRIDLSTRGGMSHAAVPTGTYPTDPIRN
jgi:hypothetical protein